MIFKQATLPIDLNGCDTERQHINKTGGTQPAHHLHSLEFHCQSNCLLNYSLNAVAGVSIMGLHERWVAMTSTDNMLLVDDDDDDEADDSDADDADDEDDDGNDDDDDDADDDDDDDHYHDDDHGDDHAWW